MHHQVLFDHLFCSNHSQLNKTTPAHAQFSVIDIKKHTYIVKQLFKPLKASVSTRRHHISDVHDTL